MYYFSATKIRNFYYIKIKEPNIQYKAHPNNLIKIINENKDLELEEIINTFEYYIENN